MSKARKQLPDAGPGAVLLAVPDAWAGSAAFHREADEIIARLFRTSGRVHAVLVLWDEYVAVPLAGFGYVRRVWRFFHPAPREVAGENVDWRYGNGSRSTRSLWNGCRPQPGRNDPIAAPEARSDPNRRVSLSNRSDG